MSGLKLLSGGVKGEVRTDRSPCLGLAAFRLSDTGDLQEELALSGVALHLARASEQLQAAWQELEQLC